jgi:DNA-binding CsgD family transcriptional regulator
MHIPEEAVDRIYEAAFVPEVWPEAFAHLAALAGGASAAFVVYSGEEQPRFRSTPLLQTALQAFTTSDAWKQSMRVKSFSTPMMFELSHRWVCPDEFQSREELDRDPVQGVLRSLGMRAQTGTAVTMLTGEVVAFSVERWERDGPFLPEDLGRLESVRPHLARAGIIAARLRLEQAKTSVALMEKLGLPAAVLATGGRVLATNSLFDQRPNDFRPRAGGGLILPTKEADALLMLAAAQITQGENAPVGSIPIPSTEGTTSMVIHVLPLRRTAHDIFPGGDMLVVVTSAVAGSPASLGILKTLFDLAPAEARLAAGLASGKSLKVVAAQQGIQTSSARTYLAQIFRKTGTHRQSELVALLKNTQLFRS